MLSLFAQPFDSNKTIVSILKAKCISKLLYNNCHEERNSDVVFASGPFFTRKPPRTRVFCFRLTLNDITWLSFHLTLGFDTSIKQIFADCGTFVKLEQHAFTQRIIKAMNGNVFSPWVALFHAELQALLNKIINYYEFTAILDQ